MARRIKVTAAVEAAARESDALAASRTAHARFERSDWKVRMRTRPDAETYAERHPVVTRGRFEHPFEPVANNSGGNFRYRRPAAQRRRGR